MVETVLATVTAALEEALPKAVNSAVSAAVREPSHLAPAFVANTPSFPPRTHTRTHTHLPCAMHVHTASAGACLPQ